MDVLRVYVLFNSISVRSGLWEDINERLRAMKPRFPLKGISVSDRNRIRDPKISRPVLNPLNYRGSSKFQHESTYLRIDRYAIALYIHWIKQPTCSSDVVPMFCRKPMISPRISLNYLSSAELQIRGGIKDN